MTSGHRHRTIHLRSDGAALHLLRTPLAWTADESRADASRFAWGVEKVPLAGDGPVRFATVYKLTPLGILHGLCGLTVEVPDS